MNENEYDPNICQFFHVKTGHRTPIEFQLFDQTADGEKDQRDPLKEGQPFLEDELEEDSSDHDAELKEQEICRRIEVGEINKGQVVVQTIQTGGDQVESQDGNIHSNVFD